MNDDDRQVRFEAYEMADKRKTAKETAVELERRMRSEELDIKPEDIPHHRTIQQKARAHLEPDPSAPWRLGKDKGADELALIPPIIAEVAAATRGQRTYLTNEEAGFAVMIRRAAPALSGVGVFYAAREYVRLKSQRKSVDDLDLFVAFLAQNPVGARQRFKEATGREAPSIPTSIIAVNAVVDEAGAGQVSAQFVVEPSKEDQS